MIATEDQQYALATSDLPLGGTEYIAMRSGDPLDNSVRVQSAVMTPYTDLELPGNGGTIEVDSDWELTMKFWVDRYPQLFLPDEAISVITFESNAVLGLDRFTGSLPMELTTAQSEVIVGGDIGFEDALSLDATTELSGGSIDLMDPGDGVTGFMRVYLDSYASVTLYTTDQFQYGIDSNGSPYFVMDRTGTKVSYTLTSVDTTIPLRTWTTVGFSWDYRSPSVRFYVSEEIPRQVAYTLEPVNLVTGQSGELAIGPGADGLLIDSSILIGTSMESVRLETVGDIYHNNQIGGPGVVWFLDMPYRYEGGGFKFGISGDGRYVVDYLTPEYVGVYRSSRTYFNSEPLEGHEIFRFRKTGTDVILSLGNGEQTIKLVDEEITNDTDYFMTEVDFWSVDPVVSYSIDVFALQLVVGSNVYASTFGTFIPRVRDLEGTSYAASPEDHIQLENSLPVIYAIEIDQALQGLAFIEEATAVVKEYTAAGLVSSWFRGNLDFSRVNETNNTEFPIAGIFREITGQNDGPLTPEFMGLLLMATIGMVGGIFAGRAQGGGLAVSIMAFFIVFGYFLDMYPLWVIIWAAIAAMGVFFGNRLRAGGSL